MGFGFGCTKLICRRHVVLLMSLLVATQACATPAIEPVVQFSLSEGPLWSRIGDFADAAHAFYTLVYPHERDAALSGVQTKRVVGAHHPTATLLLMLRGTDVGFVHIEANNDYQIVTELYDSQ
jgi:hypothetical protein